MKAIASFWSNINFVLIGFTVESLPDGHSSVFSWSCLAALTFVANFHLIDVFNTGDHLPLSADDFIEHKAVSLASECLLNHFAVLEGVQVTSE